MDVKSLAAAVRELLHEQKFDEALSRIDAYTDGNDQRLPPSFLVQKGVLIQLAKRHPFGPRDAERCFEMAIAVEPDHVKAHEELGWLHYAVFGDAAAAQFWFSRAETLANTTLTSIRDGLETCAAELKGRSPA